MTHKYSELRAKMPPEDQALARRNKELMLAALDLGGLAKERGLTQEALANQLEKAQGNVSRMLRRTDMHVSTLQQVVEAMGGTLEITAHFPDKDYRIDQFTAREEREHTPAI